MDNVTRHISQASCRSSLDAETGARATVDLGESAGRIRRAAATALRKKNRISEILGDCVASDKNRLRKEEEKYEKRLAAKSKSKAKGGASKVIDYEAEEDRLKKRREKIESRTEMRATLTAGYVSRAEKAVATSVECLADLRKLAEGESLFLQSTQAVQARALRLSNTAWKAEQAAREATKACSEVLLIVRSEGKKKEELTKGKKPKPGEEENDDFEILEDNDDDDDEEDD